jgi:hypothetical protein
VSGSTETVSTPWITLAQLKAWLNITDSSQDANLTPLLTAATQACISYLNRDLVQSSQTETYDGPGSSILPLNTFPITAVASVMMDGQPVVPAAFNQAGYVIGKFSLRAKGMVWCKGFQNVTVSYTGGYATIPTDAVQACLLAASAMFNSMAADPNLQSESTSGVFSGSFWQSGPGALPPSSRSLLINYRKVYSGIAG